MKYPFFKVVFFLSFVIFSLKINGQYFISKDQINITVDGQLLKDQNRDSIQVLIYKENEALILKDTILLGIDGDVRVSVIFIIENRAISFKGMWIKYFFDTLNVNEYRKYNFYYTHIENLAPISDYNAGDYDSYPKKHRKYYYKESDDYLYGDTWFIPILKERGKHIPKEVLFYGVARFEHTKTRLTSIYRVYDYQLMNDHEEISVLWQHDTLLIKHIQSQE